MTCTLAAGMLSGSSPGALPVPSRISNAMGNCAAVMAVCAATDTTCMTFMSSSVVSAAVPTGTG